MTRPLLRSTVALAAASALLLTGCTSSPSDSGGGDTATGDGQFPVTIEHAYGETTIEAEPERVATWGWASADAAIALGVIPVAMPAQSYGGDEEGVLPWIRDALDEAGAETPTILSEGEEAPIEEFLEVAPDVILAPYSGITGEEYELLSEIAPVVAFPDQPWATPWKETISIVGEALGRTDEADQVLADIDAAISEQAEAHPEFEGKTIAMTWDTAGTFYVYKPADPRVEFTLDLGFESAPAVEELSNGDATFFYTLSYEQLDQLESDVLVAFGTTQEEADAFLAAPYTQVMPQVQSGAVAMPIGTAFISSVSPPTALSLTWGLEDYVALLADAVANAE